MTGKEKPRRDYGDGSIYRRESDGRWVGSLRLPDGKRKSVYGKTRPEAKRKLEALKKKVEQGTLVATSKQTLTGFIDYWLSTISKSIEPSTLQNYHDVLQRVRKVLGDIQLQRLTRERVQQFIHSLDGALEVGTIRKLHTVLGMALDAAVKWKFIEANPCKDVVLPKIEENEQIILTAEQAKHLLQFVKGQPLEPFVILALGTGMRKGEICSLRWADLDFEQNTIRVDRKVYTVRQPDGHYKMTEGKPKSKASKRTIPMAPFVREMLTLHRKRQVKQRLEAAVWLEKDLIFCSKKGDFYARATLQEHFRKLLELAGLPIVPIHRLRHTCNTLLRLMGIDAVTRQHILGHAHLDETEGTYGHSYIEMQQDAMDRLDQLFSDDEGPNLEAR